MDTEKPLLEIVNPLTDERNPHHAYCSSCKEVKPIESFTRKPTPLQFKLWWGDLPYERHKKYVGKECNICANERTKNKNTFDYASYEQTLRLDPKNHMLVPNTFKGKGTKKNPAPTADYIPLYVAVVWEKRLQGRIRLKNACTKNYLRRHEPKYKELVGLLRKERNRVKMRISNGTSEAGEVFCKAYISHLSWLAQTIQGKRITTTEKAKDSPLDYVNDDRPETQEAKRTYRLLTSKDAEIIKPRFL